MKEYSTAGVVVEPVIKQGTEAATSLLGADAAWRRGSETILFVEDQVFVRDVVGKILKSAGYGVLVAKSAAEALRAYDLAPDTVELLLTDVILPRENGRELAHELQRRNPLIRVLLISGYAEQMVKSETESEFGRCLPKPFFSHALLRKVREVLDARTPEFGQSYLSGGDPRESGSHATAILSCAHVVAGSLNNVVWNFGQGQNPLQKS